MKTYALYLAFWFSLWFFVIGVAFAAIDIWTNTSVINPSTDNLTYDSGSIPTDYFGAFRPDGTNDGYVGYSASVATFDAIWGSSGIPGTWTVVEFVPGSTACQTGSLTSCEADTANFVRSVCVALTTGSCGGPTPTPSTYPDGSEVFPGIATATTTTIGFSIVDNPTQDFAYGLLFYIVGMWLMLWLFKRRN